MLIPVIPRIMLKKNITLIKCCWENKQNKTYVGFPKGYDTGEERWRTDQQISDSVHKMKKCYCSLGGKKKVCTHV